MVMGVLVGGGNHSVHQVSMDVLWDSYQVVRLVGSGAGISIGMELLYLSGGR